MIIIVGKEELQFPDAKAVLLNLLLVVLDYTYKYIIKYVEYAGATILHLHYHIKILILNYEDRIFVCSQQ